MKSNMILICLKIVQDKRSDIILASTQENLSLGFVNSKGTDQSVHPHSLISAFVICLLESIISKLGLVMTGNLEDEFSCKDYHFRWGHHLVYTRGTNNWLNITLQYMMRLWQFTKGMNFSLFLWIFTVCILR